MRVWVDLANSPHVLFFAPILREMKQRGVGEVVTARDFAQTVSLARLHNIDVSVIGRHGGAGSTAKARTIVTRAIELATHVRAARVDLAVSHNSYAQAIAARLVGIPCVTIMDYEHTPANHVSFRLAKRILLPKAIPIGAVRRYGANSNKVVHYDGFKEQVYLDRFVPDRSTLAALDPTLWNHVVVLARPPADFAIYHRFKNALFETWLSRVGRDPALRVIVLPRVPEQRDQIASLRLPSVLIPTTPLDGANLIHHADLVVSAGGTMNREAAVLGVPAYSIFAGELGLVDLELERQGRLQIIRTTADLDTIRLEKKRTPLPLRNPRLISNIVERCLEVA